MIRFTKHAERKFAILIRHGFRITRDLVISTVENPELIDDRRPPLLIAQRRIDFRHVLRVVYREEDDDRVIVTFYPGRRSQYEEYE